MATTSAARKIALALPHATEQDHHGFPSFRVGGKIFATLPDAKHLHIMLGEDEIREEVAAHPECCEEQWWGKKLAALRVSLPDVGAGTLRNWLTEAWMRRAPRSLRDE